MISRRALLAAGAAAAICPSFSRAALPGGWHQTFYLMDTWFWLAGADLSIAQQTALTKRTGYGGIALSWGAQHAERLKALQEANLATPGIFITVEIDGGYPANLRQCIAFMKGTGGRIWACLKSKKQKRSDPGGDADALAILKAAADDCRAAGLPGIALYPHVGCWMEKVSDTVRLCRAADRPDVGLQFNQYHWMAADGGKDLAGTLRMARPYLQGVSINGSAAIGRPSILPLSEGDYDVTPILRNLVAIGYTGPISHQGYSIKGDLPARLAAAMKKWQALKAAVA